MNIKHIKKMIIATTGAVLILLIEGNTIADERSASNLNRVIDLVRNGGELSFMFTPAAAENQFKGSILSGRAYLYKGGTLNDSDCTPFVACGVIPSTVPKKFVPEFPENDLG